MTKRIFALFFTTLIVALMLCSCSSENTASLNEDDAKAICELATLKCYYNNVAIAKKEKENIFQKDRELWIEYEGVATIGFDMTKLALKTNEDKVTVTLPKPELLGLEVNKETLNEKSYVASSDGVIFKNKITSEEQQKAIDNAQKQMEKTVSENKLLFHQAETRAKELITNYINQIGKVTNTEYTIEWKTAK